MKYCVVILLQDERQNRLRKQARNLMAMSRGKSLELDSPSSPGRPITQRITLSPERTISPINNNVTGFNFNGQEQIEQKPSPRGKSPTLHSFSNVLDRFSPKTEGKVRFSLISLFFSGFLKISKYHLSLSHQKIFLTIQDKTTYIQRELDDLEREQEAIDKKANVLEKKLRAVMGGTLNTHSNDNESEDQLMAQWFTLVNKKNALLRRQMQLNILQVSSTGFSTSGIHFNDFSIQFYSSQ